MTYLKLGVSKNLLVIRGKKFEKLSSANWLSKSEVLEISRSWIIVSIRPTRFILEFDIKCRVLRDLREQFAVSFVSQD